MNKTPIYVLSALMMFLFISCDRTNNSPGYIFYPDMAYSQAYETYDKNPVFAEGSTMRPPAEGTIPRGAMPYMYEKSEESRALAAAELVNPVEYSDIVLERGQRMYEIYCMICHGEQGNGQGPLYTGGKYNFPPANLLSEKMMASSEGDIFHVITVGHGIMGEHGSMISPEDRWKITLYIKNELQKQAMAN